MQGRCDNDPLDPSDDVCEICGGEYCDTCLVYPRGRKSKPVCKGCALQNSGLRGGSKTHRRTDRRSAKKRRKELEETKGEREPTGFVFFDEEPDHTYDLPEETEEPAKKVKRRRVSIGRRKGDEVTTTVAAEIPEEYLDDEPAPQASPAEEGTGAVLTRDPNEVLAELAENRPAGTSAPSATELLAKLREDESVATPAPAPVVIDRPLPMSAGGPSAEPTTGATTGMDLSFDATVDPFALPSTGSTPATSVEPTAAPAPAMGVSGGLPPADGSGLIDPFANPPAPTPQAAAPSGVASPADPSAVTDRPIPNPASVVSPPPAAESHTSAGEQPRPSLLSRLDDEAPVAAPKKAPMPAWVPPPVTPDPAAAVDEGPMEPALLSRITTNQPDPDSTTDHHRADTGPLSAATAAPDTEPTEAQPVVAPPQGGGTPPSGRADTDRDGNWVPPALRGMAPKAERDADTLPRRR